jgi:hypothetical protein
MSQEDVVALLTQVRNDEALRTRLSGVTSADALEEAVRPLGFALRPAAWLDELTDADLDGISSEATDRTCYGTTDCCHTKRTCFGTTDCCR